MTRRRPRGREATALLITLLFLAACARVPGFAGSHGIALRIDLPRRLQAVVAPYDQASIVHVVVKLFETTPAETEVASQDVAAAQLGQPLRFGNLKPAMPYRARAYVYRNAGTAGADLISDPAASTMAFTLGYDTDIATGSLPIAFVPRPFAGAATGGLVISPGGIAGGLKGVPTIVFGDGATRLDGPAASARFDRPTGLVRASDGTLYVADMYNGCIRKIDPSGNVSTFAGNGTIGLKDGPGPAAAFSYPVSLALNEATGTLYVADFYNAAIRKITAAGVVSTVVSGAGYVDDPDGTAGGFVGKIGLVEGLALDAAGQNLYFTDTSNAAVRRLELATLALTTIAGAPPPAAAGGASDGTGASARFYSPVGIARASDTVYYITDYGNRLLRRLTLPSAAPGPGTGVVATVAGNAGATGSVDGTGTAARFTQPFGLLVAPDGGVLFCDQGGNALRRYDPATSAVTTVAGVLNASSGADNGFLSPTDVVLEDAAHALVLDYGSGRVKRVDLGTGAIASWIGESGFDADGPAPGPGRVWDPTGFAIDENGDFYFSQSVNCRIRKATRAGAGWTVSTLAGTTNAPGTADGTGGAARFNWPSCLLYVRPGAPNPEGAVYATGQLYVSDTANHRLRRIDVSTGAVVTIAGNGAATGEDHATDALLGSLSWPRQMALTSDGALYVAEEAGCRVKRYKAGEGLVTIAGAGVGGFADGVGPAARFDHPLGLAAGADDALYVGDTYNHVVRKLVQSGGAWTVSTLAGTPGVSGATQGAFAGARYSYPEWLAMGADGTLYVYEPGNGRLSALDPAAGTTRTLLGGGGYTAWAGAQAKTVNDGGLAFGPDGALYWAGALGFQSRVMRIE